MRVLIFCFIVLFLFLYLFLFLEGGCIIHSEGDGGAENDTKRQKFLRHCGCDFTETL